MKINAKSARLTSPALPALALFCVTLAACHSATADKLSAARQALQATGEYEIVAQDTDRGLLTVRSKRDGALQLIDVNATGAAPRAGAPAATSAPTSPPQSAPAAPMPAEDEAPQQAAATNVAAAGTSGTTGSDASSMTTAVTGDAATTALNAAEASGHGMVLAHGPRIHIERVAGPATPAVAGVAAKPTALTGISINHAVICREGERMRLQQVRVVSPSVGIVLQPGCQLELIDSDVQSGDIALVVNAGASLRIENSTINGRIGSLQASATTRVSSWASDFSGPTLLEGAEFVDRGGNTWQ